MPEISDSPVVSAAVVLPCSNVNTTLPFFTETLGFQIDSVYPADDPAMAEISGHGLRLTLQRGIDMQPGRIRITTTEPDALANGARELRAPNGTWIEIEDAEPALKIPEVESTVTVTHLDDRADWGIGRAGMNYRDLVPDRQGGFLIASHIRIPESGPVPDYVHFHKIQFQMIYCYKGWVRVVYEDQGPPFVLRAGDCVLQPPQIRHRVLESGNGLEVIEIGCPAAHMTCVDHAMTLPTATVRPDRDFGGQQFVRHQAADAAWQREPGNAFEFRDTGIGVATNKIADARVLRPTEPNCTQSLCYDGRVVFDFLLHGSAKLRIGDDTTYDLEPGDSFIVPPAIDHQLLHCSKNLELLEVSLLAQVTGR